MPRCPVCDAAVDLARTPTAPFCGERCRLVDLGRWLDEGYIMPVPRAPADEDGEAADEGRPDASDADED